MPIAFIPSALIDPQTQKLWTHPAIDVRTHTWVNAPEAYLPGAKDSVERLRPDRTLQRVVAYLAEPKTATLSLAELNEGLREHTEDLLSGGGPYKEGVVAGDGEMYSRAFIENWAKACAATAAKKNRPFEVTSPLTRQVLTSTQLITATAMHALMAELGIEVERSPEQIYDLSKLLPPPVVAQPAASDASVRTSTVAVERPSRSPSPSWSETLIPTGTPMGQIQAIDEALMRLAQTVNDMEFGNVSLVDRARKALLKRQASKLLSRAVRDPRSSTGPLCRRAVDLHLLTQDYREARRYVELALQHDPDNRSMLCRSALLYACQPGGNVEAAKEPLSRFFGVPQHEAFDACADWVALNRSSSTIYWPLLPTYGAYLSAHGHRAEGSELLLPFSYYVLTHAPERNA